MVCFLINFPRIIDCILDIADTCFFRCTMDLRLCFNLFDKFTCILDVILLDCIRWVVDAALCEGGVNGSWLLLMNIRLGNATSFASTIVLLRFGPVSV